MINLTFMKIIHEPGGREEVELCQCLANCVPRPGEFVHLTVVEENYTAQRVEKYKVQRVEYFWKSYPRYSTERATTSIEKIYVWVL